MTNDDQDDEAPLTHEELVAKWAWKPGEREQSQREVAERQRAIDAERILAEARARAAARELGSVTKNAPATPPRAAAAAPASSSMTQGWAAYIRRQLDERDRAMTKAVAQAIVAEEKARATADDALRQEMRTTIDKLTERLDRRKAAPLRAVG